MKKYNRVNSTSALFINYVIFQAYIQNSLITCGTENNLNRSGQLSDT